MVSINFVSSNEHLCLGTRPSQICNTLQASKKTHMKKIISLLLLVMISSWVQGQEITFKSRFLPEKEYFTSSSTESKNILNVNASAESLGIMKENGLNFPIESQIKTTLLIEMKNGMKQEDESYHYTMLYKSVKTITTQNGVTEEKENPLTGLIMEGIYKSSGQVKVINLISDKVNEATKESLKKSLESVSQGIPFPDKPMKIGDSFNQVIPMTIPVSDLANVNMIVSTMFTLNEIKEDFAYFNLQQSIALNMDKEQTKIKAEGNGNGKAIYNTKYNFLSENRTNLKMAISIEVEDLIFINESETKTSYLVEIK